MLVFRAKVINRLRDRHKMNDDDDLLKPGKVTNGPFYDSPCLSFLNPSSFFHFQAKKHKKWKPNFSPFLFLVHQQKSTVSCVLKKKPTFSCFTPQMLIIYHLLLGHGFCYT